MSSSENIKVQEVAKRSSLTSREIPNQRERKRVTEGTGGD